MNFMYVQEMYVSISLKKKKNCSMKLMSIPRWLLNMIWKKYYILYYMKQRVYQRT